MDEEIRFHQNAPLVLSQLWCRTARLPGQAEVSASSAAVTACTSSWRVVGHARALSAMPWAREAPEVRADRVSHTAAQISANSLDQCESFAIGLHSDECGPDEADHVGGVRVTDDNAWPASPLSCLMAV